MVTPGSLMAVDVGEACTIITVVHATYPRVDDRIGCRRQRTGELPAHLGTVEPRERDADVIVEEGAWWLHPQG